MGIRYGIQGKTYYSTTGIGGVPAWVEAANLKNVTLTVDGKEVDVTTRANGGFVATGLALLDASIEADMPLDPTNADYLAIESAYFNKSLIGVAVMTGAITSPGERGLVADCMVTKFSREEQAEGAMEIKITLKPTRSANAPYWKIV